jgi:hypothetical protein
MLADCTPDCIKSRNLVLEPLKVAGDYARQL